MAQTNPINEAASLSSVGTTHAPLGTATAYSDGEQRIETGAHIGGTGTETGTGAVRDERSTGQKIKDALTGGQGHTAHHAGTAGTGTSGPTTTSMTTGTHTNTGTHSNTNSNPITGALAGIHGAGEKLRGEFNTAVDGAFNEPSGVAKNRAVADAGDSEMGTGHFSQATKNREGVVPGDGERRKY